MDWDIFWGSLIIFLARVADVSLITLRSAAVVQGRRVSAWCYAFLGMLIWILVVTDVIKNLERPAYILAFALGFATGTTVGMYLENWFAVGRRVIRVFSKRGDEVADGLRKAGFVTTVIDGRGRDGPTQILFIEARRRDKQQILEVVKEIDQHCYFIFSGSNTDAR